MDTTKYQQLEIPDELKLLAKRFIASRKLTEDTRTYTQLFTEEGKAPAAIEEVMSSMYQALRDNKANFPMFNSLTDFTLKLKPHLTEDMLNKTLDVVAITNWDGLLIAHLTYADAPFVCINILEAENPEGEFAILKNSIIGNISFELDPLSFHKLMDKTEEDCKTMGSDVKSYMINTSCIAAAVARFHKDFPAMVMHENFFETSTRIIDRAELTAVPAGATIN